MNSSMKIYSLLTLLCAGLLAAHGSAADLRLGVIGTDTSHAVAFAKALNNPGDPKHVSGARIVIAFKGGSPDVEDSSSRVEKFASQLRNQFGVKFLNTIPEMCDSVDGILLESLDGRRHLPQLKEAVTCGKPIFVDKPFAASLQDAEQMARVASAAGIPWFSASSLRFSEIETLAQKPLQGAIVWGPGPTEPHQPLDLTWYGIHAAEMLYRLMGEGCAEVTRTASKDADVVTCRWKDGRLGTLRVDRPYSKFGAVVFRTQNQVDVLQNMDVGYIPLVRQIVKFMTTRKSPFPNSETLEEFHMLDAAQRSKEQGGRPVAM